MRTATNKKTSPKSNRSNTQKKNIAKTDKPQPQSPNKGAKFKPTTVNHTSKQSQLIALLKGPKGSNIQELMQATGWQVHSVRGFISGTIKKKLGLNLISQKIDGVQHYRIETA